MKKFYKLNEDFTIECESGDGRMSVSVICTGIWFEPVLEEYRDITDKDEGNRIFKEMRLKYKDPL